MIDDESWGDVAVTDPIDDAELNSEHQEIWPAVSIAHQRAPTDAAVRLAIATVSVAHLPVHRYQRQDFNSAEHEPHDSHPR